MQDPNSPANPNVIIHKWNSRPIEDALRAELAAARARITQLIRVQGRRMNVQKLADENERLRAKIAELEAANRWIPCAERLPEESGLYPVLFATSDKRLLPAIRHFDIGHGWDMPVGTHLKGIVYWRPLPAPPENKEA